MPNPAGFVKSEIQQLLQQQPEFDEIYRETKPLNDKLHAFLEEQNITDHHDKHYVSLQSFYLGVLEGIARKKLDFHAHNEMDIINLTVSCAYFNALMDGEISSKSEGKKFKEELYEDVISQLQGSLSNHCNLLGLKFASEETPDNHEKLLIELQHLLNRSIS